MMISFHAPPDPLTPIESFLRKQSARIPWYRRGETYVALAMVVAGYFYGRMGFYPRVAVLILVPLWSVIATYQWVRRQRDNGTLASVVAAGVPLSQLITATANHHSIRAMPPLFGFMVGSMLEWRPLGGNWLRSFFIAFEGVLFLLVVPFALTGFCTYMAALLAIKPGLFVKAMGRRVALFCFAFFGVLVLPIVAASFFAHKFQNSYFKNPGFYWLVALGLPIGVFALMAVAWKKWHGRSGARGCTSAELEARELDEKVDL